MARGATTILSGVRMVPKIVDGIVHTPYMEQQLPCGQLPQIVFPFPAPQEPSVVTFPVGAAALLVGLPRIGSCELVTSCVTTLAEVGLAGWLGAAEEEAASVQPFWQPLAVRQLYPVRQIPGGLQEDGVLTAEV